MNGIPVLDLTDLDEFNKKYHKADTVTPEIGWQSDEALDRFTQIHYKVPDIPVRGIVSVPNSELRGLKIIEFNPTELCNRTCHFCPRYDPELYPNQKLHMTVETVKNVVNNLREHDYIGQIMFSGFGEPLLNRKILDMIKVCSDAGIYTEMTTNGDKVLQGKWYEIQDFVDAGLTALHVDIYDDVEQYLAWEELIQPFIGKIRIKLTPRFVQVTPQFNNRAGKLSHLTEVWEGPRDKPCFAPSVKAFIDWDGTVRMCCHDWDKTGNFGNVNEQPFNEIWNNDKMNAMRSQLMYQSRSKAGSPCNKCNTGGNQHDADKVKKAWMVHYDRDKQHFAK